MTTERGPRAGGGRRWSGLAALLTLFLGSLLTAAVLAPLAMEAARWLAAVWPTRATLYLAEKELPRYFDRLRWLVVLAGLPWVARATGIGRWRDLRLAAPGDLPRSAPWLLAGLATVGGMVGIQLLAGVARPGAGRTAPEIGEIAVLALVSALFVSVLEEIVFRGVVLRACREAFPPLPLAIGLAAGFFALVHFQRVPSDAWRGTSDPTVRDGLLLAGQSLVATATSLRADLLVGLLLAGVILCLLVVRYESLLPAIAMHAGWVWAGLAQRRLLEHAPDSRSWLWGGRALVDGVAPLLLLATIAGWLALDEHRRSSADGL